MVKRPPVEEWSRSELEDHFHEIFRENLDLQLKNSSLNKQLTGISARFRQIDSKGERTSVPYEEYAELEKDRQLLQIKLRSLRHQLLTYTHPTVRPMTANLITGRSMIGLVSQQQLRGPGSSQSRRMTGQEMNKSSRITETIVAEKASLIRLNRQIRDTEARLIEKDINIKHRDTKIEQLSSEIESLRGKIADFEKENRKIPSNLEESSISNQEKGICLKCSDLEELKSENQLLKKANERLISQSLDEKIDGSSIELVEIEKKYVQADEELKEIKRRLQESERQLRKERSENESLRKRNRNENGEKKEENRREELEREYMERMEKINKMEKNKRRKGNGIEEGLERLWKDLASLIGDHSSTHQQSPIIPDHLQKWEQLYAELYNELEKVRNLLLLQHEINQKQTKEVSLLESENRRIREETEKRIVELRDLISEKNKKISLLESQIHSIAYGRQKIIPVMGLDLNEDLDSGNELSLRFTQITFPSGDLSTFASGFFFSIEFFDFELQTTNLQSAPNDRVVLDYTFLYNVIVSKLFLHYIQTDGIRVELYRPTGGMTYENMGSSALSLNPLINSRTGRYAGEIKILSLSTGQSIAIINYELSIAKDLTRSLQSYASQEIAQKMITIPPDIKEDRPDILSISIHRCSQIDQLKKGNFEASIVYEFLAFSPFFTDFARVSNGTITFNSNRDWQLARGENLAKMLHESDISLYLVESNGREGEEGVLAMTVIPLSPLISSKPIQGTFPMVKPNGEKTSVLIDLSIHWKFTPEFLTKPTRIELPEPPKSVQESEKLPEKEKQRAELAKSQCSSSSSSSMSSGSSVFGKEKRSSPDLPQLADQVSTPSTSRSSQETVILEGPSNHLQRLEEEVKEESNPPIPFPRRSSASETQDQHPPFIPETEKSPPKSPPGSIESVKSEKGSEKSQGKEEINESPLPNLDETLSRSNGSNGSSRSSRSSGSNRDQESLRSKREDDQGLLGELPPIAKPRLTRPRLIENESERETRLKFTDPLHDSIPPSDTSDLGSTPRKGPIELKEAEGKSNLAYRDIREPKRREVNDTWLKIRVDSLYIHEDSILLHPQYDQLNVYVDWCLLDFPIEICRVSSSVPLPRKSTQVANFNFEKIFELDSRRCVLLSQWMRLGNRLEFNLNTDQGDDSDELAVASVEMSPFSRQHRITIALYDVNGEHVGDLDVGIEYSNGLIDEIRREDQEEREEEDQDREIIEEHSI